jgi:predicted TIM-barrel fold metal-dependent hydrolase
MIDIDQESLIDSHVHVYAPDSGDRDFDPLSTFTLGGDDPDFLQLRSEPRDPAIAKQLLKNTQSTMAFQQALSQLAAWFGCPRTAEAVLASRREAVRDFAVHVRQLLGDVRCSSMIVDMGHPTGVDLDAFEALTGVDVYGIFRIEPLIAELWDQQNSLAGLVEAYSDALGQAGADPKVVGYKSIIAYRTGLAVEPVSETAASAAFDRLKRSGAADGLLRRVQVPREMVADVKSVRDHLLWRAFELSLDLDLAFQIHTGWGDQDIDIRSASPGLLADVLRDSRLRHLRIVLLHGAYPFYEEAAYLTNIFPNVYLDLSLLNPFLGLGVHRVVQSILDLAPFTKVLFASDAYGCPELQWVAARRGRAVLAAVIAEAIAGGILDPATGLIAARCILAGNARDVYRLPRT